MRDTRSRAGAIPVLILMLTLGACGHPESTSSVDESAAPVASSSGALPLPAPLEPGAGPRNVAGGVASTGPAAGGAGIARTASTGPGKITTPLPASPPTPVPSPHVVTTADGAVLHLTAADSGRTFHIARGTRITVELSPNAGSYDPPVTDAPTVLREDNHHGGYPDNTPAVAQYTAIAPGTAHLGSQTDLACLHTTPRCLPPQREFTVTIIVR